MKNLLGKQMVGGKVVDSKVVNGRTFIIIEKSTEIETFYYEVEMVNN